jgi:uncharacterized protein YyaL (SSP411 family)
MQSSKEFTNRLIDETSPYLLQHAHNPVDWFPWGEEAFAKAKAKDKPVLVSIGYSACHWCHVMEHESFEDEATAAIMNEHFVSIKVDMEERPDVDQIYMNFVQMTTGRGGWPMNVFMTPDKRPFFGGTYFPPVSRYNMPSWQQILTSIADAYTKDRAGLEHSASEIVAELQRSGAASAPGALGKEILDAAFTNHERTFDAVNGGFGGAPKFPGAMSLEFMLRYHKRTGNEHALAIVTFTLDKMARGGIYDQIGGGFHRYATDSIWLVPHFEKMLYDNAQLVRVYLHAYQVTGHEFYKRIVVESLDYIQREMLDVSGGFYSTQDADSEGEEGKFFVWTPDEVNDVLSDADAAIFNRLYDITAGGNFEGRNIPNIRDTALDEISAAENAELIDRCRRKLFAARENRVKPNRDEKVIAAWNGLMLAAFADAAAVLGSEAYLEIARRNADFIVNRMRFKDRLYRTWKEGKAKLNGYIEDYANIADGLLVLYQATGDVKYLAEAKRLADVMIARFWDEENGGFFFTSNDHEELIVRNKDVFDNATPSGNSVAADVLLRLAVLTGDEKYERFGVSVLRIASPRMQMHPQGFGRALSVLESHLGATKEIVIIGPKGNALERQVLGQYLPDAVVILSRDAEPEAERVPLLKDRSMFDGQATAYVCENFVCQRPVTSVEELADMLAA